MSFLVKHNIQILLNTIPSSLLYPSHAVLFHIMLTDPLFTHFECGFGSEMWPISGRVQRI